MAATKTRKRFAFEGVKEAATNKPVLHQSGVNHFDIALFMDFEAAIIVEGRLCME